MITGGRKNAGSLFFFFLRGMFIEWGGERSPGHVLEHLIDSEMDKIGAAAFSCCCSNCCLKNVGAHLRKQELTDITAGFGHHLELAKMEWGRCVQVAAQLLDPDEACHRSEIESGNRLCSHIIWAMW